MLYIQHRKCVSFPLLIAISSTLLEKLFVFLFFSSYRQRLHDQRFGGSDAGLTVIVNSSQVNDVVSLLNMDAYVVIIHKASNFPDIASGEAIEVFPIHNEETFVAIKARVMNTSEKLRIFSSVYVNK